MSSQGHYAGKKVSSRPPPPDLGDPPDVIREWAEKVVASWRLSEYEEKVCWLLLKGLTPEEVAHALSSNSKTVYCYVRAICIKAGVDSRAELFAEVLRL